MELYFLVPAYNAERTVPDVIRGLARATSKAGCLARVCVVDDGSDDETAEAARSEGARVLPMQRNRGKGAALRAGLLFARQQGVQAIVSVDADGQHPADEAVRLARLDASPESLVLGVRDLRAAGAPAANQASNAISNFFLSAFTGTSLQDTQCGLRRYPVRTALRLGARDDGYAFEAEILMRACRAGVPIVQEPVRVAYPADRTSHFHAWRDPVRIVSRVLMTQLQP